MAGLSILIPVFNREVAPLVHPLLAQLPDWPGPAEIRLLDDGSTEEFKVKNRLLAVLPHVVYQELTQNVGRATIRNKLAASATHEWLLLLDNDSLLPDHQFIARYAQAQAAEAPALFVGVLPTTRHLPTRRYACAGTTAAPARCAPPPHASATPVAS